MRANYLSREDSNCIKGIFAIGVLAHHLYQKNSEMFGGGVLAFGLQLLGFLCVGMFFFLSGFGLNQSYKKNGRKYLSGFFLERVLPFYIIILILTGIYLLKAVFVVEDVPVSKLVRSFLFGETVINNGWYLQVQLMMYVLFFFAYRFGGKANAWILTGLIAVYTIVAAISGKSSSWYQSAMLFPFGVLWSKYEGAFEETLRKSRNFWMLLVAAVGVLGTSLAGYSLASSTQMRETLLLMAEFAFVTAVVVLVSRIPVNCGITRFLGKISLEVYAFQGLYMSIFRSSRIYIASPVLYCAAVCICTFATAVVIQPLFGKTYAMFRKIPRKA